LATGLLVILAAIGVVNGLWSKNLVINGTVATGDLNVDWTTASSGDDFGPDDCTDFGGFDCDGLIRKDVGTLDCFVDEGDAQILHFRISNGYPSYEADCEVHLTNTGSVPFIIRGFEIDTSNSSPPLTGCEVIDESSQSLIVLCDQLKIGYIDGVGLQIDPGDETASSVIVHVEQAAAQNTCTGTTEVVGSTTPLIIVDPDCTEVENTYEFDIKVCVAQWNEAATYDDCVASDQHEGPGSAGDPDFDNVIDGDNCPDVFNPDQTDVDVDGIGDACDPLIGPI
jgi:hypothetical protein